MNEYDIRIEASRIVVGFGWDALMHQRSAGLLSGLVASKKHVDVDFDGAATLLDDMGNPLSTDPKECCVYYENLEMLDGAIRHGGDDQSGAKEGDDETLGIDFSGIPKEVCGIALTMDLFKDLNPHISVGRVQNVYVRLTDPSDGTEICKYTFIGENGSDQALIAGFLLRDEEGWFFRMDGSTLPNVGSTEEMIAAIRDLNWEN